MPKQTGKNPMGDKLNKALSEHANDETDYGGMFGNLPPGINGGVAQLAEARLGKYQRGNNEGESFIYLAGVVIRPKTVTAIRKAWINGTVQIVSSKEEEIEGQRTSLTLPLCDTSNAAGDKTSVDENIARGLNELRKLGADTSDLGSEENLVELLNALTEAKPYFRFTTSGSNPTREWPTERVWENWRGNKGLEEFTPDEEPEVADESEEEPPAKLAKEREGNVKPVSAEEEEGMADYAAIARKADKGDKQARLLLTSAAKAANIEGWIAMDTWAEVAEALASPGQGIGLKTDEDEKDENWIPAKGDVYLYKPPKAKKFVECEVMAVMAKAKAVNLKDLDDETVYKGIPWTDLIREEE